MRNQTEKTSISKKDLRLFKQDVCAWASEHYILAQTKRPIQLEKHQKIILREMTRMNPDGRFKYQVWLYSAPKKSGKTEIGSMIGLWYSIFHAGRFGEIYILANDEEQAEGRIYKGIVKAIDENPLIQARQNKGDNTLTFSTGTFIQALPCNYKSIAGCNPSLVLFSELWGYTSENSRRLKDELTPVPTRLNSIQMIETYAGFVGESDLLYEIYERGLAGKKIENELDLPIYDAGNLFMYWDHEARMSWQTPEYYKRQREEFKGRPDKYRRFHDNEWVVSVSRFSTLASWKTLYQNRFSEQPNQVVGGLDIGIHRDYASVVFVSQNEDGLIKVTRHKTWKPEDQPVNIESGRHEVDISEVEAFILEVSLSFEILLIYADPYQAVYLRQRLQKQNISILDYAQTPANLTRSTAKLKTGITDRTLQSYPHPDFEEAINTADEQKTPRGVKLAKSNPNNRIDSLVALSFACVACEDVEWKRVTEDVFLSAGKSEVLDFHKSYESEVLGDRW